MKLFPLLLLCCFATSACQFCEGVRQFSPGYVPREEKAKIKKALKEYRISQAEFQKRYAKELEEFNRYQKHENTPLNYQGGSL